MSETAEKKKCFVVMPFTVRDFEKEKYRSKNHWNEVYEGLIKPAILKAGFQSIRDDQDIGTRIINENIFKKIEESDLILCDMSSANPNVFLEMGWAMRADKPFVLIKDNKTNYEFATRHLFIFDYDSNLQPIGIKNEIEKLNEIILKTSQDPE
jgi:hypothetical protein